MKSKILLLFVCSSLVFGACSTQELKKTEKTVEAKNILLFLQQIKGKYILSGQHNFISNPTAYSDTVLKLTLKEPAVWGCDFSFNVQGETAKNFHHCGPLNLNDPTLPMEFHGIGPTVLRKAMIQEAIKQYQSGKIVTLMWHHCFPIEGDSCMGSSVWAMENRPDKATFDSLVTDGTKLNRAWKNQADMIAGYLVQLRDAKVPVLWRPYHEMNGVWFWWCNQQGDQGFKRLWIMMHDYFTQKYHLNNLLWVWDANAPRQIPGDEAYPYSLFYPGNEYVDVLAADVYRADYKKSHQDELVQLGNNKPVGLGEIGQFPADTILNEQTVWTWFMVWGYFVNHYGNTNEKLIQLYHNPRILTADRIRRNREGAWEIK
jgi:mannan endo-1,4-beta-mannosidase